MQHLTSTTHISNFDADEEYSFSKSHQPSTFSITTRQSTFPDIKFLKPLFPLNYTDQDIRLILSTATLTNTSTTLTPLKMPKAKAPKASKITTPVTPATTQTPPNWPIFKPTLPVIDLALETLVEDKVVVYRNFWPSSLCRDYVAFLKTLPLTTTPPGKPKKGEAARHNDRFQINDPGFANRLWTETGLRDAVLDESVVDSW